MDSFRMFVKFMDVALSFFMRDWKFAFTHNVKCKFTRKVFMYSKVKTIKTMGESEF